MPKHRKQTKQKLDFKQKKQLQARLIKISMVIDDYLYKNKAITQKDANAYVEEVSNYKTIFKNDVRSLQVIEKITRCMNTVIIEQQEENSDKTINFYNTSENYCPSPVYSLPEEDKAICTLASVNSNPNIENEENIVDHSDTIDLCDEDDVNIQRDIQVDVEIHRAMSTLSIRNNEPRQEPNIIDSSQNLLMDFNANREEELRKMSQVNISKPTIVSSNKKTSVVNVDCSQSILKEFEPNMTVLPVGTRNVLKQVEPAINHKTTIKVNAMSNKSIILKLNRTAEKNKEIKNVRFNNSIETIDITEDDITPKKKSQRRTTATKKPDKVKRKISKVNQTKSCKINKSNKNTKLSQEPIQLPTTSNNTTKQDISTNKAKYIQTKLPFIKKTTNDTVYQKTPSDDIGKITKITNYNRSMEKIYNTNIENDLSWMENIRFVREISTDEFDPKYAGMADIFWENFDLPSVWNESDFDYND